MNNKTVPIKNIKVQVKLISGDVVIGDLNISGFDRYSDFIKKNNDDCINLSKALINAQSLGNIFVTIFKSNITYIKSS